MRICLAAVLTTLLACGVESPDGADDDGKADGTASAWRSESSGTTSDLSAVWGAADGRYFALAQSGTAMFVRGAGSHGTWKRQAVGDISLPGNARMSRILDVAGQGSTAYFAVTLAGGVAAIAKLDGTTWSLAWTDTAPSTRTLVALAVAPGGDIAAVFTSWSLVRFRGGAWQVATVANPGDHSYFPVAIAVASSGDVFVTGSEFYNSGIYRLAGTKWTPEITNQNTAGFVDLWSSGDASFSAGEGGIVMREGPQSWADQSIEPGLHGIWGASADNVYAAGTGILHFDGTGWKKIKTTPLLLGIAGVSASDVVAVGTRGAIFHYFK